jgi:endoribonuclease Dicer
MAMVSNKFFGAVAVKLGFHRHLKHSAGMLIAQINEYAQEIQLAAELADGAMDYWMATKDPPKVIATYSDTIS